VHDPGALEKRSVEGGWLTLNTRGSYLIYDNYITRSQELALQRGQELRLAWRMETEYSDAEVWWSDVAVGVTNSESRIAQLFLAPDSVAASDSGSATPDHVYQFAAGTAHEFLFRSADMATYDLYVDQQFAFAGQFGERAVIGADAVAFGDTIRGLRSLSAWDYFEVADIPEPSVVTLAAAVGLLMCFAGRKV
jgi:hypothetical protein